MKFGIYARELEEKNLYEVKKFIRLLESRNITYILSRGLRNQLKEGIGLEMDVPVFSNYYDLEGVNLDVLVTFGGDGTFLDSLTLLKNSGVPVLGINTGRLGFLANIPKEETEAAIDDILENRYVVQDRSLLKLESDTPVFEEVPFALNDFTVHKRDNTSMITIKTFLDDDLFNTYWADGVIITTPTGSTGYSLSCGGPIIFPDSLNFAITPVAPHNLNIRPLIVPDTAKISFEVSGRGSNYLISMDSRYEILDYSVKLSISKAPFLFKIIKLNRQNFIKTLREKLMWGLDSRNT